MEPVKNEGILPESKVFLNGVTDACGPVREEYETTALHEFVFKKKCNEQFESLVHSYGCQCVLFPIWLNVYNGIFNKRLTLLAFLLSLGLLEPYSNIINADITAFCSTIFNFQHWTCIFQFRHTVSASVVLSDEVAYLFLLYACW